MHRLDLLTRKPPISQDFAKELLKDPDPDVHLEIELQPLPDILLRRHNETNPAPRYRPPQDEKKPDDKPSDAFFHHCDEHLEAKEEIAEQINHPHWLKARRFLWFLLSVGSVGDGIQFRDGLSYIPDMSIGGAWLSFALYILANISLNKTVTDYATDELITRFKGDYPEDWEKLSGCEEWAARIIAFIINGIAITSDVISNAYYLEQAGVPSFGLSFLLGTISAFGNIPTESWNTYLLTRSWFTKTTKTINAAYKKLQQHEHFIHTSPQFKRHFPFVWGELSAHLRIALPHYPQNEPMLLDDGKELAHHIAMLITRSSAIDAQHYLQHHLHLEPATAQDIAKKIMELHAQEGDKKCEAYSKWTAEYVEKTIKFLLKAGGFSQDLISSFVSMTTIFEIADNLSDWRSILVFLLSLTNGVNDLVFSGKNCEHAINRFKAALAKGMPEFKDGLIFILALCAGCYIGVAQGYLISSMIPEFMPGIASMLITSFGAAREATIYTDYLIPVVSKLVDTLEAGLDTAWQRLSESAEQKEEERRAAHNRREKCKPKNPPKLDETPQFIDDYFAKPTADAKTIALIDPPLPPQAGPERQVMPADDEDLPGNPNPVHATPAPSVFDFSFWASFFPSPPTASPPSTSTTSEAIAREAYATVMLGY